ncbi:periplasmic heavy metal sensor [Shumkonia mesophila]|uniref:periplasmic heavy metal sensor n=1 Tax=Shumkonia mesophila TaxID=2838854 RepID=UPI0029351204|nr:periplasmic heavy metal sensor [Shumkonia mesophila]
MKAPVALRRWRAALFWGSLALNIVLVGIFVLHPRLPFMPPPPPPPPPEVIIEEMADRLDAADRKVFETAVATRKAEILARHQAIGAHFDAFKAEFLRQPFDGHRFQDAKAKLDDARAAFESVVMETMVESLAAISPSGRERLSRMPGPP